MSAADLAPAEGLERAREILAGSARPLVLTGAGVSAESGVPTFRGPEGLWKRHRPEELATPEAFLRDPRLVWEWYAWRRGKVASCRPNAAHHAIARVVWDRPGARVVTQNVDGLHERAARDAADGELTARERPLELHGSLFRVRCTRCALRAPHTGAIDATERETLPRCSACAGLLRPDVVWFGEALEPSVVQEAFRLAAGADVCLVVGTSALVHPAASLPLATLDGGGVVIEVNPEPTPLSSVAGVTLRGAAGLLLPLLLAEARR